MSSVNLTITHNEAVVSEHLPFVVSGWYVDNIDRTLVSAEREGYDPVNLLGEVLTELNAQRTAVLEEA